MEYPSQWGVPDWQNALGYPNSDRRRREWAWEFLRRNHAYRTFWKEKIEPYVDSGTGRIYTNSCKEIWPHHEELKNAFGVDLPSPPWCSTPCYFMSQWLRSVDDTCAFPEDDWLSWNGEKIVRVPLRNHEVAPIVNIAQPLRKQLKALSRAAEERQEQLSSTVRLSRKSTHLSTYLRILDARDAGADRTTIESTLFQHLENEYPERQRSKTFDNFERAAKLLRDRNYRELITA